MIIESLRMLVDGVDPTMIEVLVVCNGCVDDTAARARSVDGPIRVLETANASKAMAINLGAEHARFPQLAVCDADVRIRSKDLMLLSEALREESVRAVAPAVRTVYESGTSWIVRGYYRFWMSLPYVKEGMMAAGVYALDAEGVRRVLPLPKIIADDGFVRASFSSAERKEIGAAISEVRAPVGSSALVRIKTRSRLGQYELRGLRPDLHDAETRDRDYFRLIASLLRSPALWLPAAIYLYINLWSRWRARRQLRKRTEYVWERDDSSRSPVGVWAPSREDDLETNGDS